jgi:sulfite oxidase
VPGYIGARSVKWLGKITVSDRPSPNHYVAEAYKIVQSDDKTEAHGKEPIYAYSVNAAICTPAANNQLTRGPNTISGYALPAGDTDCRIDRVEVSADGGLTWSRAKLLDAARPFSWVRWSISLNLNTGERQLAVRATDSHGNTMPERFAWNFKGYLYNAWHRIAVQVA